MAESSYKPKSITTMVQIESEGREFKPYQKHIFLVIFLTSLALLLIGDVLIVIVQTNHLFTETRQDLIATATGAAKTISVNNFEAIQNGGLETSIAYTTIEQQLKLVQIGNPKITDIYTLRPSPKPHVMTFVTSIDETRDKNGNGMIDENEIKPAIGEEYDTSMVPDLELALQKPSADKAINYDKWGAWISGYAPLIDENGGHVGIVGVDLSAKFLSDERNGTIQSLAIANAIFLPVLVLFAYFISRLLSRPLKILAVGLDHLVHGDVEYELPLKGGKETQVFHELIHAIGHIIKNAHNSEKK